jgi:hypothetical protein
MNRNDLSPDDNGTGYSPQGELKYSWTLLAAPNSFGSTFHWIPVRNTKKIAANTCPRQVSVDRFFLPHVSVPG